MFSGLFGGGGSAKRAANVAAQKAAEARGMVKAGEEKYGAYYTPFRQAGEAAIPQQQQVLGGISERISGLDPKIAALYEERAGLQPQVSEMYGLAQQQDPVVQEILGGGQGFQTSPGYQFALEEGQKALERSRAAGGTLGQGATGKELTRYGQGMANQEYQNYLNQLQNRLGAVGTQLGGRQAALGAGQEQINQGVNLLGQDYNQITAQQNLASQYQQLINSGMSAADAAARLGMDATNVQAGLTKGIGETYAGGIVEKDRQMKSAGDQWLNLAATAVGLGQPFDTAGSVQNPYTAGGGTSTPQQQQAMPQQQGILGSFGQGFNQGWNRSTMPQVGVNMPQMQGPQQPGYQAQPWQNPDLQTAARLSSTSSYGRAFA